MKTTIDKLFIDKSIYCSIYIYMFIQIYMLIKTKQTFKSLAPVFLAYK